MTTTTLNARKNRRVVGSYIPTVLRNGREQKMALIERAIQLFHYNKYFDF